MKRALTYNDEKCGLACLRPDAFQKFADIRLFVVLMCVVIGVQGTYLGYAVGILTTLEKRFEISSSEAGVLLAMYDIGHTCTVILVGYCLADRHKPRWTAYGVLLSSLAMFSWTLPNFIFGTPPLTGAHQNYVNSTKCDPYREDQENATASSCKKAHNEAYAILCIAQLFAGIAAAPFNTVSYIYIDDNVSNRQSPFFLGILTSMYAFGPAIGFGLSSLCTMFHADLKKPEGLDYDSPSWIGAWWLGFVICGVVYLLTAIPLMCFPYRIPDKRKLVAKMEANLMMRNGVGDDNQRDQDGQSNHESCFKRLKETTKDLPFAAWNVIKNPVFSSMVVAWIFGSYLVGGYGTFLPQYIETQYTVSAAVSAACACLISIGSVALSTAVGGYLLSKFDIKPRRATLYLLATWSVIVVTYLLGMGSGCRESSLQGTYVNGKYDYVNDCNEDCQCGPSMDFDPVYNGNTTYFSACYAGCKNYIDSNKTWTDCTCVDNYDSVVKGIYNNCNYLPIYLTVMFIGFFIGNLFFMTTMMVVLRCVEDEERSLALSFASCLTNLFGFIPSPIIFGAIIDSSCNVWHSQCPDERGSCIQYDNNDFRHKYHLSNAGFQFVAICALFVCYLMTRTFEFPEEREDEEYEFQEQPSATNRRTEEVEA